MIIKLFYYDNKVKEKSQEATKDIVRLTMYEERAMHATRSQMVKDGMGKEAKNKIGQEAAQGGGATVPVAGGGRST